MAQFTATIDRRGNVTMDAEGFVGESCAVATKGYEDALQAVKVTHDTKPEFYESEGTNQDTVSERM